MSILSDHTQARVTLRDAGAETARLYDAHRQPILRYLSTLGLVAQDCDEIVQETFTSLYLHLRDGKPKNNLRGWIFRVAHNNGLRLRFRNTSRRSVSLPPEVADFYADASPGIEHRLLAAERAERVRAVVNALSQEERQCLFLRAEGLRYREIARVLGVSVGTVSTLLTRSIEKLRRSRQVQGF